MLPCESRATICASLMNIATKAWFPEYWGRIFLITTGLVTPAPAFRRARKISAIPPVAMRSRSSYFPNCCVPVPGANPCTLDQQPNALSRPADARRHGNMRPTMPVSPFGRALAAALVLTATVATAEPALLLVSSLGRPSVLTVHGRLLESAPTRGSSVFSRNLRRLAAAGLEHQKISARVGDAEVSGVTGEDGAFSLQLPAPEGHPFPEGISVVQVRGAGAVATVPVQVVADSAPFLVVSDIDDTVIVSNVIHPTELVRSALFQDSDTHPPVPGMAAFYACLRDGSPAAPGFAYVSGSPVQYGPRLSALFKRAELPFGGLYLRDLSLRTLSNYKQPVIRKLAERFPQKLVLIGDAGEHDPEVYAQLRKELPGRIARIYIRQVRPKEDEARFPDMFLFRDAREAALDAAAHGLLDRACVDRAFPPPAP